MTFNPLNTRSHLKTSSGSYTYFAISKLSPPGEQALQHLPFSIRILLENVLRHCDGRRASQQDVENLLNWQPQSSQRPSMPYYPGRIVMQDFSGVPVMNDLAAMRAAWVRLGGRPEKINPLIPVDVVIDHSIQVDVAGTPGAYQQNTALEMTRNRERYEFLHWCQQAFQNVRIIPPASGIIHQVNLEHLSRVAMISTSEEGPVVFAETQVGTDSHTTMINGLGVVGWGVGGIEAVSAMLGEPIEILAPDVIGVRLTGSLPEGVTPTDATLTITQMLRKVGVVEKFIEFYGPGLDSLTLADRAMIANMTPETGATMLYFPVDEQTLAYLRLTGRPEEDIELAEQYYRAQHIFRTTDTPDPHFTQTITLDLGTIEPSLAGPKRPQDRISLSQVQASFREALRKPRSERGYALSSEDLDRSAQVTVNGQTRELRHGAVVLAAITSCTNTSNPSVMLAAGLLAKKAVEKGLSVSPTIKTSLAPGSRAVIGYLQQANLMQPLETLGFHLVGYGCTTCIGNSGPLPEPIVQAVQSEKLIAAAVLSGNRNFEGRVSPHTQANYLASPPLVIAYALAGTMDIDLTRDPLGTDRDGQPVYLRDIWPASTEIDAAARACVRPELFAHTYQDLFTQNAEWNRFPQSNGLLYAWQSSSTYLQEPPFFMGLTAQHEEPRDILQARVLALFGDSITTDHISPAGSIPPASAAGQYLQAQGVPVSEFNSYGARRGNDRVLTRGTLANIRIKNQLLPNTEGSLSLHLPDEQQMSIYDTAMRYQVEAVPLVIIAGKEYGTGSSRDWAAKGVQQLGVRAIIAESYERIHRSNLAGMAVLPLQFKPGQNAQSLGLNGRELFSLRNLKEIQTPGQSLTVDFTREDGQSGSFEVDIRLDTAKEVFYFQQGGILNAILRSWL